MAASDVTASFLSRTVRLKSTLQDAGNAFQSRHLHVDSYHSVVELGHLQLVALFETFLEGLFYECMLGRSGIADVNEKISLDVPSDVDLIVYSEGRKKQKYLSWLPYDETLDRANAYLERGQPFSRLKYRTAELTTLKEALTVRNAVAHTSGHAGELFKQLAEEKRYTSRRPADYLVSTRSGTDEASLFISYFEIIAQALAETSETTANAKLTPERPFRHTDKPPSGQYECVECRHQKAHVEGVKLGRCPYCSHAQACPHCGNDKVVEWRRML